MVGRLLDSEMQGGDAVAARHRRRNRVRHHGVRVRNDLESETVVIHTGADAVEDVGMQHRVDKYMHRQRAVGTRRGCQYHRAVARRIEGDAVPCQWQIVLANGAVHRVADIVIDIEYQCNGAVTSLNILNYDCIDSCLRERCVIKRVGQIILIDRLCDGVGSRHQDSEAQIRH